MCRSWFWPMGSLGQLGPLWGGCTSERGHWITVSYGEGKSKGGWLQIYMCGGQSAYGRKEWARRGNDGAPEAVYCGGSFVPFGHNSSNKDFCTKTVSSVTSTSLMTPRWPLSWHRLSNTFPFNAFTILLRSFAVPCAMRWQQARAPPLDTNSLGKASLSCRTNSFIRAVSCVTSQVYSPINSWEYLKSKSFLDTSRWTRSLMWSRIAARREGSWDKMLGRSFGGVWSNTVNFWINRYNQVNDHYWYIKVRMVARIQNPTLLYLSIKFSLKRSRQRYRE